MERRSFFVEYSLVVPQKHRFLNEITNSSEILSMTVAKLCTTGTPLTIPHSFGRTLTKRYWAGTESRFCFSYQVANIQYIKNKHIR